MRTIEHTIFNHAILKRLRVVIVMLGIILLCTFLLNTMVTAKHTNAAARDTYTTYQSIRISSGDSLWSIAQEYRGVEDTQEFVEDLMVLNNLSSDRINSGSYILVPVTSVL